MTRPPQQQRPNLCLQPDPPTSAVACGLRLSGALSVGMRFPLRFRRAAEAGR
jgi:hypothetical protein